MAKIIKSPDLACKGVPGLPKYVFILSLENRSFDHLFGRSGISGKNADPKKRSDTVGVEGVFKPFSQPPTIDPKYANTYVDPADGQTKTITVQQAVDKYGGTPPWVMTCDPKHEFEHILCQACGPDAVKQLFTDFSAAPDSVGINNAAAGFLDTVPPPPQCNPAFVRQINHGISADIAAEKRPKSPSARPDPNNSGYVHSFVRSYNKNAGTIGSDTPDLAEPCPDPELVMACLDTPNQLPILNQLAASYVICDNFFSSLPGPTGPNRFFMMAGSSAGYDGGPSSAEMATWTSSASTSSSGRHVPCTHGNVFTHLAAAKVPFRIYGDDNFPMAGVMEGVHPTNTHNVHIQDYSLAGKVSPYNPGAGVLTAAAIKYANTQCLQTELGNVDDKNEFPYNFVWIEPDYDVASSLHMHPMYSTGNSMHPCSDIRKAEQLIADIYNWITAKPSVWNNCVFIITWDEHGGFYDHVTPPTAPAPGDSPTLGRTWSFDFKRLGTRVPCLVISPFIQANLVDQRQYDHGSILKLVVDLNNAGAFAKDGKPSSATHIDYWTNRVAGGGPTANMFDLFPQDSAPKTDKVALATPLTPDAVAASPAAQGASTAQNKPSGNTGLFLASAANLSSLPADGINTNEAAANYFGQAANAVDNQQMGSGDTGTA